MERPSWGVTIIIIICLVAIFTNPSVEEHKQAVKAIINKKVQSSLSDEESDGFKNLGVLLGSSLAEKLIENSITRDNYVLFSITKASWKDESKTIGYGLFGNVFLSREVNDAFNNQPNNDYGTSEDVEAIEMVDTTAVEVIDTGAIDH